MASQVVGDEFLAGFVPAHPIAFFPIDELLDTLVKLSARFVGLVFELSSDPMNLAAALSEARRAARICIPEVTTFVIAHDNIEDLLAMAQHRVIVQWLVRRGRFIDEPP